MNAASCFTLSVVLVLLDQNALVDLLVSFLFIFQENLQAF